MKKLLALCVFLTAYFAASHVQAAVYYFNNAVNTDPTELGNYWYEWGGRETIPTDPALELPDLSSDEVTIIDEAIYNGDMIFNGEATNRGQVTGDAIFNGDDTENQGTVVGSRTRRYTENVETTRDFTLTDEEVTPWIIVADGAVVNLKDATFDSESATLSSVNGGLFVDSVFLYSSVTDDVLKIVYDDDLNPASIPDIDDYQVFVNNLENEVVDIEIDSDSVVLTLENQILHTDTIFITYTSDTTPLQSLRGVAVPDIEDLYVGYAIPTITPYYLTMADDKLYVSNANVATVSVINTANGSADTSIDLGDTPFYSVGLGHKVYVSNTQDTTVSVLDTQTDTVVETIDIGSVPGYIVTANGKIYVTALNLDTIVVIDATNDAIIDTISVGDQPGYLTVVGTKIYVSQRDGTLTVIDTTDDSTTLVSGIGSDAFYATAVGTKLYVNSAGTLSVVDTTTDTFLTDITVTDGAYSFSVIGTKLYVTGLAGITTVVDTVSDTVIEDIPVGFQSYFSTYANKKLYVSNNGDNTVTVIDPETDEVLETLYLGKNTYHFAVIDEYVYVAANNSDFVSIINTRSIPSALPNLTSFSTSASSGSYSVGQSIPITAHFGRSLQSGSTMTVLMNTGRSVVLSNVSGSTLSGTYVIQAGDQTPDLSVKSITSASVTDATNTYTRTSYDLPSSVGDFEAENSFITRNLGDAKNIKIGDYQFFATGDNPYQLSAPINGFLYVANQGAGTVSVINATTGVLAETIDVGDEPYGLAVNGTELYVANTGSDTVSVINTSTNTVTHTINVGVKPYYVATIGTNIYVTNSLSNTVSVINTVTHAVTDTIPVGSYPRGIKAHGTDLYVANYGDPNYSGGNYISVIDSLINEVSDTIILPAGSDGPRGVTSLADKVYVTNFRSNNISVIDTATNTITDTIDVGMGPRGILGTGTILYVENFDDGTISVIDTATNDVTDTINVGHSPSGMSLSDTTLYITSFQDNRVYALDTTTNTLIGGEESEEEEEEPEEESPRRSSGGTYVAPAVVAQPIESSPTDCLPSYKFSPSTGKPCSHSSSTSTPPSTSPILSPFTRNLKLGMIGDDVKALQIYLNTHGFPVSFTGPGSHGFETTKFGGLTQKALIKFQQANKISPAIGYFGKVTRGFVEAHK